jgi:prophage regulatory protein
MTKRKKKTVKAISEAPALPLVLRKKKMLALIGLSASTVYNLQKAGSFPQPIQLGLRATGWLTTDIEEWLAGRAAERAA